MNNIILIFNENLLLILDIILTVTIPLIVFKIIKRLILKIFKSFDIDLNSVQMLIEIIKGIVVVCIIIGLLNIFGIDIQAIVVSLGLVSVAVSLAARDTLANFISGIMVMIEQRFKIGDVIKIDNHKGHVKLISFKSVILVSDNKEIIIPNSVFSIKPLINYTKNESYLLEIELKLLNKYNLEEKIVQISNILKKSDLILNKPKYQIIVKEFTTVGVILLLKVWIANAHDDDYTITEINKEIKKHIEIEDLHLN